eukprot:TRINITY_DN2860_c0_g1_i1.p1 TRINITY_DN2860_c0_g1~~TRINITY_DN2860_c0_g1_i1.p1  ORF type:complete len:503 (-),score=137.22 TRINITY_DN2860_c0_g1_i1:26-1534(-)
MVVLAAAITTKTGKCLLSRQFVELTKARIEGLLAAFPKLMGTEKQHTFTETDSVRYVYQPLESLYVLLITNKSSNILEDLETIHLLSKIIPEYSKVLEEKEVLKNAFEIIFAFDEVIAMGYKERVNVTQVKHFMSMESHNEERAKAEEKAKMTIALQKAKEEHKRLQKQRMDNKKYGISPNNMGSISSGQPNNNYTSTHSEPVVESTPPPSNRTATNKSMGTGLKLGLGKKTQGYSQVLKEENVPETSPSQQSHSQTHSQPSRSSEALEVQVIEKLSLRCNNDGQLLGLELTGELLVTCNSESANRASLIVSHPKIDDFVFRLHPNMDRSAYPSDMRLQLQQNKTYPLETGLALLKWRWASKREEDIPLVVNLWPSPGANQTTVPVEYSKRVDFELEDVQISIPMNSNPQVNTDQGSSRYDSKEGVLHWTLPLIDQDNRDGTLEFTVFNKAPPTAFFPVNVSFNARSSFAKIQVQQAIQPNNTPIPFRFTQQLQLDTYQIEQ